MPNKKIDMHISVSIIECVFNSITPHFLIINTQTSQLIFRYEIVLYGVLIYLAGELLLSEEKVLGNESLQLVHIR